MRSITTEIYEELYKTRGPLGINRTDVLQHVIDYLFLKISYIESKQYNQEFPTESSDFEVCNKKEILEEIKKSYTNKEKL